MPRVHEQPNVEEKGRSHDPKHLVYEVASALRGRWRPSAILDADAEPKLCQGCAAAMVDGLSDLDATAMGNTPPRKVMLTRSNVAYSSATR